MALIKLIYIKSNVLHFTVQRGWFLSSIVLQWWSAWIFFFLLKGPEHLIFKQSWVEFQETDLGLLQ